MTEKKVKIEISADEEDSAFTGPAYFANRFFVHTSPRVARITFTEQSSPSKVPVYRTAVTLTLEDVVVLQKLLKEMVPEIPNEPTPEVKTAKNG